MILGQAKPKDYKPIPYQPKKKIDTEEKLDSSKCNKLEHAYTFWVKIQEQNFQKKKEDKSGFNQNELMEIESIDTVSEFPFIN